MKLLFVSIMLLQSLAFGSEIEARPPVRPPPNEPPRPPRPPQPPPPGRTYFDWGVGRDGYGYCYEWIRPGIPANNGMAQPNQFCERVRPSYFDWSRAQNGRIYCFQFTPYNVMMNQGAPVPDYYCR